MQYEYEKKQINVIYSIEMFRIITGMEQIPKLKELLPKPMQYSLECFGRMINRRKTIS